jgi:hypothetical protein
MGSRVDGWGGRGWGAWLRIRQDVPDPAGGTSARVVVERHGPVVVLAVDGEVDLNTTVEVEVELALVATLDSARLTAVPDALIWRPFCQVSMVKRCP